MCNFQWKINNFLKLTEKSKFFENLPKNTKFLKNLPGKIKIFQNFAWRNRNFLKKVEISRKFAWIIEILLTGSMTPRFQTRLTPLIREVDFNGTVTMQLYSQQRHTPNLTTAIACRIRD